MEVAGIIFAGLIFSGLAIGLALVALPQSVKSKLPFKVL